MKEQLYTIPVMDAYKTDCECPVCAMRRTLEERAIDYTMGPSYMEDDVRAETDKAGFCDTHIQMLYKNQNRLGLALMLKTHMDKTITDLEKLTSGSKVTAPSLFKKKQEESPVKSYVDNLNQSCFVCARINQTFERYLVTVFYLYKNEPEFKKLLTNSKGICTRHFGDLYNLAPKNLSGNTLNDFIDDLNQLYLSNMKRVRDDLEWFTDKFDYRYADEPWKNSKDALPRTIIKTNSTELA